MVLITVTSTEEPFTCNDKFVTTFHTVVRKVFLDTGDTHEELHHGLLLRGCVGNWVEMPSPKQSHSAIRYDTDPVVIVQSPLNKT